MPGLAIIIPCHNEEKRLDETAFFQFLCREKKVSLIFVDDGSTDKTKAILNSLSTAFPDTVSVLNLNENYGKAEAVRKGMLHALSTSYIHIGFLDADLSTGFGDLIKMHESALQRNADYSIGSRIKMLPNVIERSALRHLIGRTIGSIVDYNFNLGVYDTQCGAKLFTPELIRLTCTRPFKTRWLFDIEILLRIRNSERKMIGFEQPLEQWHHKGSSKLRLWHSPLILYELFLLLWHYRGNKKPGAASRQQ